MDPRGQNAYNALMQPDLDQMFHLANQRVRLGLNNRGPVRRNNPFRHFNARNLRNQARREVAVYRERDMLKVEKQDPQSERVAVDGDVLCYQDDEGRGQVGVFIAGTPLTPALNYFEVEILDTGLLGAIGVGLVPRKYSLNRQPGWNSESVAYHADDGKLFKSNGRGRSFGSPCEAGDKIGCGIKFELVQEEDMAARNSVPVFFTKNGKEVGTVMAPMPASGLWPAIGMHSEGEEVRISLDKTWECKDHILMSIDNFEDDWARLHDIRLNGQVLEYIGRGKSITDVGLAQARYPLNTTHHYFEIEITDPGENCYIAIGLARRDYPSRRHPGWNKGSIAYHADDGKIFIGSGIGDQFGPRCNKGDVMGCGILFPRDYNAEHDSDGTKDSSDVSEGEEVEDYIEVEDYNSDASDDEMWFDRANQAEKGTKIDVFFTKNGKLVGRRPTYIPLGGFFPTVGMLSSDEKVRVELRPLTG